MLDKKIGAKLSLDQIPVKNIYINVVGNEFNRNGSIFSGKYFIRFIISVSLAEELCSMSIGDIRAAPLYGGENKSIW